MAETCVVVARSNVPDLVGGATYDIPPIQLGSELTRTPYKEYNAIRGFVQTNVAGNLHIYQAWNRADLVGALPLATPPAIVNVTPYAGGLATGLQVVQPLYAPWVRVAYVNGPVAQASFRLHLEAIQ